MSVQKPFLKWIGGKTQIIDKIIEKLPKEMNNYHEIFLGGGSVLFAVLSLQKQGIIKIKNKIFAYDINPILIHVFKNMQNNKEELFKFITFYILEYHNINGNIVNRNPMNLEEAKSSKESYYYYIRNQFNKMDKSTVECSALFMFLNKTCFRGMYREGPKGFNVPYGHYKKTPTIISRKELDIISELIKDVAFIQSDFIDSFKCIEKDDFVYMDPPYVPITKASFVNYTTGIFKLETHTKLFEQILKLYEKNIKFILSNSKCDLVFNTFNKCKNIQFNEIVVKRLINSKNPSLKASEYLLVFT